MTTYPVVTVTGNAAGPGLAGWIRRRPLAAYFILAFAGMWLMVAPLALSSAGLFALPDLAGLAIFVLSAYTGPALAAFVVTGVVDGRAGVARLWRRMFQWRAGLRWYAVALFAFLAIWLAAYSLAYAGAPLASLVANWPLLLTSFLPNVALGLIVPGFGEEPGWRGFALPRLQAAYGPIGGTLILGGLHGVWHLPAMFTPLLGPFSIDGFVAFVLTAMAGTFIYTWVFNNTRGSVLIAVLTHAASNAASTLMGLLVPAEAALPPVLAALMPGWFNVLVFSMVAMGLAALTRGTLGYRPGQTALEL
jgi:membrane protease YdiL (CAAX protease family)